MDWPLTGRAPLMRQLAAALGRDHFRGLEVVGEAGVGKSRLAAEFGVAAAASGRRVEAIHVSPALTAIPYGALAQYLAAPPDVEPTTLRRSLLRALDPAVDGAPPVLVVDDAHFLDAASASLLRDAVDRRSAFVVLTRRSGRPLHESLAEAWKDGALERFEVRPLNREATTELVTAALGRADGPTLAGAWRLSRGNPLFIRELIVGAIEDGHLVRAEFGWQLVGELTPSARLSDLIEARLGRLDEEERRAAESLAVGEPLDLAVLEAMADAGALERLEERNLVEAIRSGNRQHARLAHPIYAEVLLERMPETRKRRIKRKLADQLERPGLRRRDDLLRLALWRLEGGEPGDPDVLVTAGQLALASFDPGLAERLARAAMTDGGSPVLHPVLVLGEALAAQHRIPEAEETLRQAIALATTDEETSRSTLALAQLLYFRAGRIEESSAVLVAALESVRDPDWRDELESLMTLFRAGAGDLEGVARAGHRVASRPGVLPRALTHTMMYSSIANVMLGRIAAGERDAKLGLTRAREAADELPLAGPMLQINRAMAHAYAGRLGIAIELANDGYRSALEGDAPELTAMWGMNLAECLLLAGQIPESLQAILTAVDIVRRRDPFSVHAINASIASILALWMGERELGRNLYEEVLDRKSARDVRSQIQLGRAGVWITWADSGADAAAEAAAKEGDIARSRTHLVWAALLYHDAVRLGRPEVVVDRLESIAEGVEGELVPTMAVHGRALASGDGLALERVASAFAALDSRLYAAEAAVQAHEAHAQHGRTTLARVAAGRAAFLAARCPGVQTPALSAVSPVPLTDRELEVASLAADGMSSRALAERLEISVRTVDNHLASVYDKLGVAGRGQLADVLGVAHLADASPAPPR